MTLAYSGNINLAARSSKTVCSDPRSAGAPSTKKVSSREKNSKGQNMRKVANGSVPAVEASASVMPTAKAAVSGKSSQPKTAMGDGKNSKARSQTPGKSGPAKADVVLKKLRSVRGVTIAQVMEITGWQAHSVRGFLSGVVKKKLRYDLVSEMGKDGLRRYRIAEEEGSQSQGSLSTRKSGANVGDRDSTIADHGNAAADSGVAADSIIHVSGEAAPSSAIVANRTV